MQNGLSKNQKSSGGNRGAVVTTSGDVQCEAHGKRVAAFHPDGLMLWCKADGGHGVLLTWEQIEAFKRSQEIL